MGFYSESNVDCVTREAKEYSDYLSKNSIENFGTPFSKDSTRITRKVFADHQKGVKDKIYNDFCASLIMGEMRGYERIMKYLEETDVFKDGEERDNFYSDILMLMKDLSVKIREDFGFLTNISNKYLDERFDKYINRNKTEHIQ